MKTKNMLIIILAVFYSACSHDIDESDLRKKQHSKAKEEKSMDDNPSGRLGIGLSYSVSNQWAVASWTRKGDFNGDGLWDIISLNIGSGVAYVKLSQGESASAYTSLLWSLDNLWSTDAGYMFAGDFNGDGYTDLASANSDRIYMKINNQNGSFSFSTWLLPNQWGQALNTLVGDFNGDGRDDIASISGSNTYVKLSTGTSFQSFIWTTNGQYGGAGWTFATDYDGDGRDDLVSANGGQLMIKQSTSSGGFTDLIHTTTNTWGAVAFTWAGDTNNNGKGELISANGSTIYIKEQIGTTSTWSSTSITTANTWGGNGFNFVENFNGTDGDDIVSAISAQIFVH